ncbi:hypothetical protein ES703_103953 [subsurface metagenome]
MPARLTPEGDRHFTYHRRPPLEASGRSEPASFAHRTGNCDRAALSLAGAEGAERAERAREGPPKTRAPAPGEPA